MAGTTRGSHDPPLIASRLRRRVAFAVFLLVVLAGSAVLYPQYRDREDRLAEALEATGKALILSLLRLHGEVGPPAKLAAAAAELAGNTVLAGGTIVTATGLPLASFGEPPDLLETGSGGAIPLRSRNEEGTRFEFYWPAEALSAPVGVVGRLDASGFAEVRRGIRLRDGIIVLLAAACAAAGAAFVLVGGGGKSRTRRAADSADAGSEGGDAFAAVATELAQLLDNLAGDRNFGSPPDAGICQAGARLKQICDALSDAVFVVDTSESRIADVNESACGLLHYSYDDLVGLSVHTVHPFDFDRARNLFSTASNNRPMRADKLKLLTRSGNPVPVAAAGAPLPGASQRFVVVVARRMPDRRSVDRALEISEQRFQDIADLAGDWIWEMDAELRMSYLSPRFFEIFPVPADTVIGKKREEFASAPVHELKWKRHLSDLARRRPFKDFTYAVDLAKGGLTHIRINGKPIFDEGGSFLGYRGTGTDCTAQIEAERKAAEAHTRLVDAIERIDEGFALYDGEERLVICNNKYKDLLPGDMATKIRPGARLEDLVREHERLGLITDPDAAGEESIKRRLERHRNPGEPFVRRTKDGRWLRTAEYRTSDGGTVGLHTDITEALQHQQELAEKSSILENTFDNMTHGIYMVGADLRILSVNRRLVEILDIPADLCRPGRYIGDLFRYLAEKGEFGPGDVETQVGERIEAVKKFEPTRFRWERRDGAIIEISRNPLPGGGYVTTLADVTDGARADEALRASRERLSGILEISEDAIISVDGDHNIVLFNRGAENIFGYAADEVMGRHLEILLPASVRGHHAQFVEGFVESHDVSRTMTDRGEITGLRKSGAEFPAEASISRLELGGQRIFTVMLRDVTERKRTAWEREQLMEQVHQAQKMEAVGTLAAGIAHDFNNLLVSILGYADLGLEDLPDDHPVRGNFLQVRKAGHRATKLVQQMMTMSRKENSDRHSVRLGGVVAEALELMRASIPSSIQTTDEIFSGCRPTLASENEIHQVVVNLCMNASHAIGSDNGTIEVRLEDVDIGPDMAAKLEKQVASSASGPVRSGTVVTILFGEVPVGACVRLTVKDTGRGMDRATMSRIFEPFFTEQEVGEGTGLGLYTVHGIVAAHEGAILVTSAPNQGSTFEIYLPALEVDDQAARARDSKGLNGTERVLFVDDERDLVGLAKQMLERLGYMVEGVTSSTVALERFRLAPEQWDLVITDQTMPQLTGEALAREILAIRENIPIILCTGFSDVFDEESARAMGIRGYLHKPTVGAELAAVVRQVLDS